MLSLAAKWGGGRTTQSRALNDSTKNAGSAARVFRRLSKRFRLVDQQAGLLHRRFGFRGGISFHVEERGYEGDLKLDLILAQRGRAGQGPQDGSRTTICP
jgi:hypothetical protein